MDSGRGLYELILAFTLLYALAESFICNGEGREPELGKMLEQFKVWYVNRLHPHVSGWSGKVCPVRKQRSEMLFINLGSTKDGMEVEPKEDAESLNFEEMPELDSYSFVRAGKWWAVLARDKWKCLSCGRSAREDGVLLEVDHIIPRSKGGSDDVSNLQTLCKKCNIGKSNKDSTRLCASPNDLISTGFLCT